MTVLLKTYYFTQPDIVSFCHEANTSHEGNRKDYAKRLERFFANRNLLCSKDPHFKNDIKILAEYSAIITHRNDQDKTIGQFIVNHSDIDLIDPALLSRFEKTASKLYLSSNPEKVPKAFAGCFGIQCNG